MSQITAETELVVASELTASTAGVTPFASPLDANIAVALADEATPAETFAELIRQAEVALDAAQTAFDAEHDRMLDPACTEPGKAKASLEKIELAFNRLAAALPKLQSRYELTRARAHAADWAGEYARVEAKRDALARELTEVYPTLVQQLAGLFERIAAADKEIDQLNGSAPRSDSRRLKGVELKARGLDHFTSINPPIARDLRLPHPGETSRLAFPPHAANFAVQASEMVARAMAERAAAYGPDWHAEREAEIERRRADTAAVQTLAERTQERSKQAYLEDQQRAARGE